MPLVPSLPLVPLNRDTPYRHLPGGRTSLAISNIRL
jgi:hypothetical protein